MADSKFNTQNAASKSSSPEYLTSIAAGGESAVEIRYENENIWLTQKLMVELYDVSVPAVNQHLITDSEIDESSAIKKYLYLT